MRINVLSLFNVSQVRFTARQNDKSMINVPMDWSEEELALMNGKYIGDEFVSRKPQIEVNEVTTEKSGGLVSKSKKYLATGAFGYGVSEVVDFVKNPDEKLGKLNDNLTNITPKISDACDNLVEISHKVKDTRREILGKNDKSITDDTKLQTDKLQEHITDTQKPDDIDNNDHHIGGYTPSDHDDIGVDEEVFIATSVDDVDDVDEYEFGC